MVSLYAPNATMTVGAGATAAGLDEIRQFWLDEGGDVRAREPLGLGSPGVQARDHGQRRPGHVALRVPLHRYRDRRGRVRHDRRLRCGPDRREVADHEHGRRNDRPGSLTILAEERELAGRPGGAATDRRSVRPGRRAPAGQGPDEAADRVRRHVPAARRGRPAWGSSFSGSRTIASRASGRSRERAVAVRPTPGATRGTSGASCRENAGPDFSIRLDGCSARRSGGRTRCAVDAVRGRRGRSESRRGRPRIDSASRRLWRTRTILRRIANTADELSTLMRGGAHPRLRDRQRSRTRTATEEMLPLRAACRAARERPLPARRGPGGRDAGGGQGADRPQRELLRELPRPCSSASRRGRSSSRCCSGSSSRGR